eukprot:jgi/Bigna1/71180/fgenesh1_pg.14_\
MADPPATSEKQPTLNRILQVLPYGNEGAFGFEGWKFCTPDPDPSIGKINLLEDRIIKEPVVEIASAPNVKDANVYVQFPDEERYTGIGAKFPIATFQLKNIGMHTGVELECKAMDGNLYTITSSTASTICKLQGKTVSIPMVLVKGWNKVEIDMEYILSVIGRKFKTCESVKIISSCRLRRIYLSDRRYKDWELPEHLRILPILEQNFQKIEPYAVIKDEGS